MQTRCSPWFKEEEEELQNSLLTCLPDSKVIKEYGVCQLCFDSIQGFS